MRQGRIVLVADHEKDLSLWASEESFNLISIQPHEIWATYKLSLESNKTAKVSTVIISESSGDR